MVISIRCRWLINHFFSLSSLSLRDDEDVGVACCFLLFPSSSLFSIILNTDLFFFFFYSHHCDWSRSHCWPKLENKGLSLSFVCPPLSSFLSFILWLDSRGTRWGFFFFLFFFSPIHWWLYTALSAFFFLFFSSFEQQNRSNKRPVGRSVWLVLYFVVVI